MGKSKLTLYIFIALIFGVIVGYIYNVTVVAPYNNKINTAETSIKMFDNKLVELKDTTTILYKDLKHQRVEQAKIRKINDVIREGKVEYFTILSDIFLRLIK
ncbi:MAG TPA: dicarboxylate/amino acid:cation symporter, partial [Mucilaginibacter sp.]